MLNTIIADCLNYNFLYCMQFMQDWVKDLMEEWNKDWDKEVLEEWLRESKALPG